MPYPRAANINSREGTNFLLFIFKTIVFFYETEDQPNVDINLALGKEAFMSMSWWPVPHPERVVDGNTNGYVNESSEGTCAHTTLVSMGADEVSWWEVDLGSMYTISKVVIYNRGNEEGKWTPVVGNLLMIYEKC